MTVRTKRLANFTGLAAGVTLYTAPVGYTAIVKTIVLCNNALVNTRFDVMQASLSANNRFISQTLAPGEVRHIDVWVVIPGPSTLHALAIPAAANARVAAYGTQLEGVSP